MEHMEKEAAMKRKILFFIEIVILAVLLPACLRAPVTVFEGRNDVLTKDAETEYVTGENFELLPGVYRICVQAEGEEGVGAGMEVGLDAGRSLYRSLRGNRGSVFAGTGYKEIVYYVTAKVPEAHVVLRPFSEEEPVAYSIHVDRTAAGYRMLFVMMALGFLMLDGLLIFHDRIAAGKLTPQKKWIFAGILGTVFIAAIPLTADWLILGENSLQCLRETEYVLRGEAGQVPVLHLCYLWLPVILRRIGFPVMTAYKGLQQGEILFAVMVFYITLSVVWKKEQWFLPGMLLGVVNPVAVRLLYGKCSVLLFLLYVIAAALLLAILGGVCRLSDRKLSAWVIFAVVLILVLQAVYFENRLIFQSEPLYWYNEEPFMTGDT